MEKKTLQNKLKKTLLTGALTATASFLITEVTPQSWQVQADDGDLTFSAKGKHKDGACGEGQCGGEKAKKKKGEKKCGEGQCGKKSGSSKECGEGKCGG